MKVKVIDLINNEDELYHNADAEDLLYKHGVKKIAHDLDIDRHDWYEIATDIYKCEDGYVGVTGLSNIYSSRMCSSDCNVLCYAEEYEEVKMITYMKKIF